MASECMLIASECILIASDCMLNGHPIITPHLHPSSHTIITGSPMEFIVHPGPPFAPKSKLFPATSVGGGPPSTGQPCEVLVQLVDRFNNNVDVGGSRLEAKVFGPKASDCQVMTTDDL